MTDLPTLRALETRLKQMRRAYRARWNKARRETEELLTALNSRDPIDADGFLLGELRSRAEEINQCVHEANAYWNAYRIANGTSVPESDSALIAQGGEAVTDCRRDALSVMLSSLIAAVSILERAEEMKKRPSQAVASDTMFRMMLRDYHKAIEAGRTLLKEGEDER